MFCLGVIYTFSEDRVEDARAMLAIVEREANKEPGCKMFVVHQAQDDPRRFFLYEQYVDQAAFEAHQQTPHFQEYVIGKLRRWCESREAVAGTPIAQT